jgi:hypothetical protein
MRWSGVVWYCKELICTTLYNHLLKLPIILLQITYLLAKQESIAPPAVA